MNLVIAGATGLTGRQVVSSLLLLPQVETLTLLVRRPWTSPHPKIREVHFEKWQDWKNSIPYGNAETWICTLGTTLRDAGSREAFVDLDQNAVLEFARLARNQGARRLILVSSRGADPKSPFFYIRTKGKVEKKLREQLAQDFTPASAYPELIIFRPGILLGDRSIRPDQHARPFEKISIQGIRAVQKILPRAIWSRWATEVGELAESIVTQATRPFDLQEGPRVIVVDSTSIIRSQSR